jgi:uncharacterized protein (TIGR02145 family)
VFRHKLLIIPKLKVMKKFCVFCLIILSHSTLVFSQVAINTDGSEPDGSAILDVKSTEKGFLPPRLTVSQQKAINNPAAGLLVFNTDLLDLYVFNGSYWLSVLKSVNRDTIFLWRCGDTLIDQRDDQTYTTVQIGTQCWMKENLNYPVGNSWCYENNASNCAIYGRLYNWAGIMNGETSSNSTPSGVQGVCPNNWHIPSEAEWDTLVDHLGGLPVAGGKMKEAGLAHWIDPNTGATNESGFTGLPGGYLYTNGSFYNQGYIGEFWSCTQSSDNYAYYRYLFYNYANMGQDQHRKDYGESLRCLKD